MAEFEPAVEFVLSNEGGYEPPLPADPGGETNFGISKRAYPSLDIKALTVDQAKAIYLRDYWKFGAVNDQTLANKILDICANLGETAGVKLLQLSLVDLWKYQLSGGQVAQDGKWGPQTLAFVNQSAAESLLADLRVRLVWRYHELILHSGASDTLALGWFRRAVR